MTPIGATPAPAYLALVVHFRSAPSHTLRLQLPKPPVFRAPDRQPRRRMLPYPSPLAPAGPVIAGLATLLGVRRATRLFQPPWLATGSCYRDLMGLCTLAIMPAHGIAS